MNEKEGDKQVRTWGIFNESGNRRGSFGRAPNFCEHREAWKKKMLDVPPSCESKKVDQGVCGLVLLLVRARGRLLTSISVEEGKERATLGLTVVDWSNWRRGGM